MVKVLYSEKKIIKTFKIESNKTILDLSRIENIAIEGSCDGSMACSTCHVIIHKDWLAKLPNLVLMKEKCYLYYLITLKIHVWVVKS